MSNEFGAFEVEVEVEIGNASYRRYLVLKNDNRGTPQKNQDGFYPSKMVAFKGILAKSTVIKMFQFEDVSRKRAIELGKEKGKVKTCRKIDPYERLVAIEKMELDTPTVYHQGDSTKIIAMEEMPWKRNKRRETMHKDKETY